MLRDGFALTAAGENPPFAGVARELLLSQLSEAQLNRSVEEAAEHVMDGFAGLELHADVASGIDRLHEDGFRLVTLSNGAAVGGRAAAHLGQRPGPLRAAALGRGRRRLEAVAAAPTSTPRRSATSTPDEMLLVAVHPWDVDGARRAGLQSCWVNRSGAPFPATFLEPTYTVGSMEEIAELWD